MYYFIVNPASGSGRGRTVWNTVRTELDRNNILYKDFLLSRRGEARALAASLSHSKQPFTLIVVGGDGTINETIDGLFSGLDLSVERKYSKKGHTPEDILCKEDRVIPHITFGCIPTGSGNDFVRGLHLAKDPIEALHAILDPKELCPINIGITQSGQKKRFFAVSSGIGFDASVCNCVLHSGLKNALNRFHSGKLVYMFTALWILLTMKRKTLYVTINDGAAQAFPNAYFAAAMNLRYEGGGFLFCPDAKADDGCLDLIVANNISRLRALTVLPLALFGRHTNKRGVTICRCKTATIKTNAPLCVHTDGEIPGFFEEVSFSLHEKKLAVIIR